MWYEPEANVVIYPDVQPSLLQRCTGAFPIDGHSTCVPATLPNLQIARALGYQVIRPLTTYNWPRAPHIKNPFVAQTETANFLTLHPRAHVLSDMGTGKTLAALWAADALMSQEKFSALIVAPLSTLTTVWSDTVFQNFLARRKLVILHGTEEQRLKALATPADFYCLNHDGVKVGAALDGKKVKFRNGGFAAALAARTDIRMAIVDEVGAYRDHRSLRSKVCRAVVANRDYYWAMTGTPMPNAPTDAYGLAWQLNGANGEYFTACRNRLMMQTGKWKWLPRQGSYEAGLRMLMPYIRYSIEDCQDLPELTMQDREVELSADQRKALKEIKREFLLEMEKGTVSAVNEAALRSKMLQICQGAVYDDKHAAHILDCKPRISALKELIENESAKTIVFCGFTSVVNRLNEALTDYTHEVITGATTPKERARIIQAFQNERDPHVLLAHPETISHGQTLTAAATTVWFGPIDKADVYIQANKRMHRPGQLRPCTVVNLAGSPVEREAYKRLGTNQSLQGLMLKLAEMGI